MDALIILVLLAVTLMLGNRIEKLEMRLDELEE